LTRAVLYGFATGGLVVALMAAVYSQSSEFFLSPVFQWSLIIPYLIGMVLALLRRPAYTRSEATRVALVVFLLANACYYAYTVLLYEVIDPDLYQLQSDLMIANQKKYGLGEPGELSQSPEIRFAPENFKYTFGKVFLWYAQGAIFGAAVAFLLSFLLGRKDPETSADNRA
jgi:hypothetical protein